MAIQSLSDLKEVAETSLKGRLRQELGKLKKKKSVNAAWQDLVVVPTLFITVSIDLDTDAHY